MTTSKYFYNNSYFIINKNVEVARTLVYKECDNKMSNIADEILKTIKYAVDKKAVNCDRTYQSAIKEVTPKGYVVLDSTGSERTVKCCIPGLELKVMQRVWLKEPMGDLRKIHICGVMESK